MAVDCEGNSADIDTECRFGDGQEFTVSIQVVTPPDSDASPPDGGYNFIQTKLAWESSVLSYRATADAAQEVVWDECDIPARSDNSANPDAPEPSVLFACVPLLDDNGNPHVSTTTGPALLFAFTCTGQGESTLNLIPREGDVQQGTHFGDKATNPIDATLDDASVTCGGAAVERPAAEVTANPPPPIDGATPEPAAPTATPGGPTPTPGGPTVTPAPTAEPTPAADGEDDDDGGLALWVWIVIGVGAVAGAATIGGLAWLRMRGGGPSGEGPTSAGSGSAGPPGDAPSAGGASGGDSPPAAGDG
jgi:hypothetical protein